MYIIFVYVSTRRAVPAKKTCDIASYDVTARVNNRNYAGEPYPRKALRERNEKDIIRKHIASAMQRLLLRVRNGRYDRSKFWTFMPWCTILKIDQSVMQYVAFP